MGLCLPCVRETSTCDKRPLVFVTMNGNFLKGPNSQDVMCLLALSEIAAAFRVHFSIHGKLHIVI